MRNQRTGGIMPPVRTFFGLRGMGAAIVLATTPLSLFGAAPARAQVNLIRGGDSVAEFHAARGGRPLWLAPQSGEAAQQLVQLLATAQLDRLDPRAYNLKAINKALRSAWGGNARAVQRAELLLSQAYVAYANDLKRNAPNVGTYYVDPELAPRADSPRKLLEAAAAAGSLQQFVADMGWMNPVYGRLRSALASNQYEGDGQRQVLRLNLDRARQLPWGTRKYVVVNAAAQHLQMYEGGRVVDEMRVVVGRPKHATPMMSALVRFASLNPYWYVPRDLAAERIAPNVVKYGLGYLKSHGYQVMGDWHNDSTIIDPATVDWQAVADGRTQVTIRQLPGKGNSMGSMKFMFPNREGVYLHDTPDKQLLTEASRLFSGGCVRLEDAPRLGAWMFGKPLKAVGAKAEQKVMLEHPVPVFLTYLTAMPSGSSIAYFDDIYGRDSARLASSPGTSLAAR
ncbi:MAG TPA: L,D-transpeptidase family protein [Sphingomicrobium sp.]